MIITVLIVLSQVSSSLCCVGGWAQFLTVYPVWPEYSRPSCFNQLSCETKEDVSCVQSKYNNVLLCMIGV